MALWVCNHCGTKFAVGLAYCPQCTSTDCREDQDGNMPRTRVRDAATSGSEPALEVTEVQVPGPVPEGDPGGSEATEESANFGSLTVLQLQEELRRRGLPTSGSKVELVARLEEAGP